MDSIILNQPSYKKFPKTELMAKFLSDGSSSLNDYISSIESPRYLFWDKAMYKQVPGDYTSQEAWLTAKLLRKIKSMPSPVIDEDGQPYTYSKLSHFERYLHMIDLKIGGKFIVGSNTSEEKQKFITRGIIEEAIASSQLEGASTTRKYAKK